MTAKGFGGLLTAMHPATDGKKWIAKAKDHLKTDNLDLNVYAIAGPGRLKP